MADKEYLSFEASLSADDFGLIIGKDGSLKGLFVPSDSDDEIPESIIKLVDAALGVNILDMIQDDEDDISPTLH